MPRRIPRYPDLTGWLSPDEAANLRAEIIKWIDAGNAGTKLINAQDATIRDQDERIIQQQTEIERLRAEVERLRADNAILFERLNAPDPIEEWRADGHRQVTITYLAGERQKVHIEVWDLTQPGTLPGYALIADAWGENFEAAAAQIQLNILRGER